MCIKFYRSYHSIKKYGSQETEGIENGVSYVFAKIDGTNASVWSDGEVINAGSRKRHLSLDNDNASFYASVINNDNLKRLFEKYPDIRLYGEWLVPHSLKTYRDDAWKKFYVFDVIKELEPENTSNENENFIFLSYEQYQPILEEFGIDYIMPLGIIKNGSLEKYLHYLTNNGFLIKDGCGVGEGVVIKNYDYVNKYGRITWAKIVTNEFKEKHYKTMGAPEVEKTLVEEKIVEEFITEALVDKEYSKIVHDEGNWSSKYIPRLLNTVYYCLITEELWTALKKFKYPTINFKALNNFATKRVKNIKPELF